MRRCSAPMLRRRIKMRMQLLILRTHMEMTLCLRQCDRRPRRPARCHQASRLLWSRWRRSCHHCPRHHHHRSQHHHRSLPARCRQRPSTSAGVTARCSDGSGASFTSLSSAMALPPPVAPLPCRQGTGEVPAAALHLGRRHCPLLWRKRLQLHLPVAMALPPPASLEAALIACCWRRERRRC